MDERWAKAIGIGGLAALGGVAVWQSLSPATKRRIDGWMGDFLASLERQRLEEGERRRLALQAPRLPPLGQKRIDEILLRLQSQVPTQRGLGSFMPTSPISEVVTPALTEGCRWHEAVTHPSIILILGKRGSGKSGLSHRLLELFRYRAASYVVGAPDEARSLLPSWIGMAPSLEAVPAKAIALVDEAYLQHHSRESQSEASRTMSQLLNLSRQREQTMIFVTQEARQVDRNIASSANVIVFKEPGPLQFEFERPELRRIAQEARAGFESITKGRLGWSYVYSPDADFAGMIENELPSYWSNKLSHLYALGQGTSALNHPVKMTLANRRERAQELRSAGLSYAAIARELGVSKSTAINYVRGHS